MISVVTQSQRIPIDRALKYVFESLLKFLNSKSGRTIEKTLVGTVKDHIKNRYPGSKHYDPEKVTPVKSSGNNCEIDIDIPGICRAYHDHNIVPKNSQYLTIPIHQQAYGKKVSDFNDLFRPKGKNALARINESGHLVWMFALAKRAFQKQDRSLMPTDSICVENILDALTPEIDREINTVINKL